MSALRRRGRLVLRRTLAAFGGCIALMMVIGAAEPSAQRGAPPAAPGKDDAVPKAPPEKAAPKGAEATRLFDGRTLDGWKVFVPNGADAAGTFSVVDGVLVCSGSPAGYIATEKEYESFELELEWRFDPARGAGNSGVLLRVDEKDQVWPRSMEAQLHSGNAGDIWNIGDVPMKVDPARTEGRRTRKMEPSSEKPLGEWNHYRIKVDGGSLELYVNGVLQNKADACEVGKGRIALQSEGAHIEFRNIVLRPIEARR